MRSDDLQAVIDLIVAQQAIHDRNVPTLGSTRTGLIDELDDLEPRWTDTVYVARTQAEVVGVVLVEWDRAANSWIHGPWIDLDDDRWVELGCTLVAAAVSQLPNEIVCTVMTATVEHHCISDVADRLGWSPSEVNHVLVADAHTIGAWPEPVIVGPPIAAPCLRPMTTDDVDALRALHEFEFPDPYYTAAELATRTALGQQTVLIADNNTCAEIDGYVAGRIQPDGDGYIDFLAVATAARQNGTGRRLVTELCRQLVPNTTTKRVCLTVQNRRTPARNLYETLDFTRELSMIGYEATRPFERANEPTSTAAQAPKLNSAIDPAPHEVATSRLAP